MWMKRRKQKDPIVFDDLKDLSAESPVKYWVNLFLFHIYKDSISSYTLDQSQGIPPVPYQEELPDGELSFEGIINRLKTMAGLDPVKYKNPTKGSVPLGLGGIWYRANMVFNDANDKSICSITLTTEGKSITPA